MSETREKATERMRRWRAENPQAGALAVERWKRNNPAGYLLRKAKDRARLKRLEFDLTREWLEAKLEPGVCEVTGLPFSFEPGSPWSPSIDRRDPSIGYLRGNCRLVVWMFNAAKSVWTDEDVLKMAKALS